MKRVVDTAPSASRWSTTPPSMVEFKVAIRYGEGRHLPGRSAKACWVRRVAQEVVLVPDVSKTRAISTRWPDALGARGAAPDEGSLHRRFDLESPELNAFSKRHVELLTLLASEAAVAIENARLWEAVRDNEGGSRRSCASPSGCRWRCCRGAAQAAARGRRGVALRAGARARRRSVRLSRAGAHQLVVAVGDVSGKGVPAALYSVFAAEVVRGRTFRRRLAPEQSGPAAMLTSINRILHERQLEEYYCTLCYALFDLRPPPLTMANSGLPFPCAVRPTARSPQIALPGVPLGSFRHVDLRRDSWCRPMWVTSSRSAPTASPRPSAPPATSSAPSASPRWRRIASSRPALSSRRSSRAMHEFRGDAPHTDDQTAVVVRIMA